MRYVSSLRYVSFIYFFHTVELFLVSRLTHPHYPLMTPPHTISTPPMHIQYASAHSNPFLTPHAHFSRFSILTYPLTTPHILFRPPMHVQCLLGYLTSSTSWRTHIQAIVCFSNRFENRRHRKLNINLENMEWLDFVRIDL